jgi:hypothetical protein
MMESARSSETLVNLYQTTGPYNPEDSHLLRNESGSYLGVLVKYLPGRDVFQISSKRNLLSLWGFSDSYLLFAAEQD